ncbi:MAG: IscS subfamily cysteine desulfurase [Bacteroidota bacterium]
MQLPVYLDNNATTACDPRVVDAMLPYFTRYYGNAASRSHSFGWQAEEAVNNAREQIARLIGAGPEEIIFTSGATEADNLAIKGVSELYKTRGNHIITVATEHKAVLDTCEHLEKQGSDLTYLPVQSNGIINLEQLEAAIKPSTILIAVMYANNETGIIQPVREISALAKKHGIIFFSDAVQAAGKIPVDVNHDGIDLLALTAHKIYGPKGVGALYKRRKNPRVKLAAQLHGGGHEKGMRSGTLNVPGIVGFGKAAELALAEMDKEALRLQRLRDRLENALLRLNNVEINGSTEHRMPHVCNLSFKYTESEGLMMGFNQNIAVSAGSACSSATLEPSYVLKAMGLSDELAHASLRFSLGRFTTEEEIDYAIGEIIETVTRLRKHQVLSI